MKLLIRFLRKFSLLKNFNLVGTYPHEKSIKIPVIKSIGYSHYFEEEPWLKNLLKGILLSPLYQNSFIDIGVNIGQTLLKVKSINSSIEYIGFEPNPNCLFYLNELLECNAFENVSIFPLALSTKSGVIDLDFFTESSTDSSASIVPGFRKGSKRKMKIPMVNGADILLAQTNKAGLIKVDVEGGELEVIKGILPLIQRDRPVIICEVLPVYSPENVFRLTRQKELEEIFSTLQYKVGLVDGAVRIKEIGSIGIHTDITKVNYLFFPEEKREELGNLLNIF